MVSPSSSSIPTSIAHDTKTICQELAQLQHHLKSLELRLNWSSSRSTQKEKGDSCKDHPPAHSSLLVSQASPHLHSALEANTQHPLVKRLDNKPCGRVKRLSGSTSKHNRQTLCSRLFQVMRNLVNVVDISQLNGQKPAGRNSSIACQHPPIQLSVNKITNSLSAKVPSKQEQLMQLQTRLKALETTFSSSPSKSSQNARKTRDQARVPPPCSPHIPKVSGHCRLSSILNTSRHNERTQAKNNNKQTLRSRSFRVMQHLISLVDVSHIDLQQTQNQKYSIGAKSIQKRSESSPKKSEAAPKLSRPSLCTQTGLKLPESTLKTSEVTLKLLQLHPTTSAAVVIAKAPLSSKPVKQSPKSSTLPDRNPGGTGKTATLVLTSKATSLLHPTDSPAATKPKPTLAPNTPLPPSTSSTQDLAIRSFPLVPKGSRLYDLIRLEHPDWLLFPSNEELDANHTLKHKGWKIPADKVKATAERLSQRGSAGVWFWNSLLKVADYWELEEITNTL